MENIEEKPTLFTKLKSFFLECKRVFRVTKKPSSTEYKTIVKVSAIGIALIGIIGFLIYMIWILIQPK